MDVEYSDILLSDFLLAIAEKQCSVGKNTYARSFLSLRKSILKDEKLSQRKLRSITKEDLQAYVDKLANSGLKTSSIRYYLRVLSATFKAANLPNDVLKDVEIPETVVAESVPTREIDPQSVNWYAAKMFVRDYKSLQNELNRITTETYVPMTTTIRKSGSKIVKTTRPLCALVFFRCRHSDTSVVSTTFREKVMVYSMIIGCKRQAAPISDYEMKMFRLVTSSGNENVEYIADNPNQFKEGQRVRVIAGEFEGAEGTIVRIKKDRRLVVTITGVCAVATPHLPSELLQPI